jgi:hypothetical protein
MGLLDGGLQTIVGNVFGRLLLDATLHSMTLTPDGEGGVTKVPANHAVKAMVSDFSDEYRAQYDIPETDVRILILQSGVAVEPNSDMEITVTGYGTFSVKPPIRQDPAKASWEFRGSPV